MGKEYWYWGSATKSSKKPAAVPPFAPEKSDQPGCISAVFHFFDFHHLHFPNFTHQPHVSLLPHQHSTPKVGEAPRNSLEESSASILSSTSKEEENLKIPAMGMRVKIEASRKTRRIKKIDALNNNDNNYDGDSISSSPAAKTPNLVARLMGLDLLPENYSTSPSTKPTKKNHTTRHRRNPVDVIEAGTRSLPETPRISAARRSDVDYHHRLSLQLNKENSLSINEDENRSPGVYAKQRVKQIKESISSRKVGIDITNTVKSRGQPQRKDHEVIGRQFKSNKTVEPKKNQNSSAKKTRNESRDSSAAKFEIRVRKPQQGTGIMIRNKQEESFVQGNRVDGYERKKCKKTPLSPHLLHISVPNLPHVKKDDPCPPETKIIQKKEPSETQKPKLKLNCHGCGATDESAERQYITNLLRRTGIIGDTVVSSAPWLLDPSVFYCIEDLMSLAVKTTNLGRMRHRSNRKLIFDFLNMTMLTEFSNPAGRSFGSTRQTLMSGTQLVETLISKLRTFPQADCRVVEDIDALVEIDLQTEKVNDSTAVVEESEAIVRVAAAEILEGLVDETAAEICRGMKRHRFRSESTMWSPHGRSRDHMRCHEML